MTHGEILFLALVLATFAGFAWIIAYLSYEYATCRPAKLPAEANWAPRLAADGG